MELKAENRLIKLIFLVRLKTSPSVSIPTRCRQQMTPIVLTNLFREFINSSRGTIVYSSSMRHHGNFDSKQMCALVRKSWILSNFGLRPLMKLACSRMLCCSKKGNWQILSLILYHHSHQNADPVPHPINSILYKKAKGIQVPILFSQFMAPHDWHDQCIDTRYLPILDCYISTNTNLFLKLPGSLSLCTIGYGPV